MYAFVVTKFSRMKTVTLSYLTLIKRGPSLGKTSPNYNGGNISSMKSEKWFWMSSSKSDFWLCVIEMSFRIFWHYIVLASAKHWTFLWGLGSVLTGNLVKKVSVNKYARTYMCLNWFLALTDGALFLLAWDLYHKLGHFLDTPRVFFMGWVLLSASIFPLVKPQTIGNTLLHKYIVKNFIRRKISSLWKEMKNIKTVLGLYNRYPLAN